MRAVRLLGVAKRDEAREDKHDQDEDRGAGLRGQPALLAVVVAWLCATVRLVTLESARRAQERRIRVAVGTWGQCARQRHSHRERSRGVSESEPDKGHSTRSAASVIREALLSDTIMMVVSKQMPHKALGRNTRLSSDPRSSTLPRCHSPVNGADYMQ